MDFRQTIEYIQQKYNLPNILAEIYVTQAANMIKDYLNYDISDDEIYNKYFYVIVIITTDLMNISKFKAEHGMITSMSQGSRSVSYSTSISEGYELSEQVKGMLPMPRVRLF